MYIYRKIKKNIESVIFHKFCELILFDSHSRQIFRKPETILSYKADVTAAKIFLSLQAIMIVPLQMYQPASSEI